MKMDKLEKYIEELKEFNTRSGGHEEYHAELPPHQPILLLALIKLYDEDDIDLRKINPNSEKLFDTVEEIWNDWLDYGKEFEEDRHITNPCFYLENSQDFWNYDLVKETDELKYAYQVLEKVERYYFDDDSLIQLLDVAESRDELIKSLKRSGRTLKDGTKKKYFSGPDKKAIEQNMGL